MGSVMRRLAAAAAALALTTANPGFAGAASPAAFGSTQVNYKIMPTVHAQVVPNYLSGFGPTGGLGSGSTPAAGAGAVLGVERSTSATSSSAISICTSTRRR